MKYPKPHNIHIPIYNRLVRVLFVDNMTQAVEYFDKEYSYVWDDMLFTDGFVVPIVNKEKQVSRTYMCLLKDIEDSILVHESLHAAWSVLDDVGVEVTYGNDEALAYLTQFIFSKTSVIKEKQLLKKTKTTLKA